jgi:hypothetical protein
VVSSEPTPPLFQSPFENANIVKGGRGIVYSVSSCWYQVARGIGEQ